MNHAGWLSGALARTRRYTFCIAMGLSAMNVFHRAEECRAEEVLRYIDQNPASPVRQGAVIVGDSALVHTGQISAPDSGPQLSDQVPAVLNQLTGLLQQHGSSIEQIVRMHACVSAEEHSASLRTLLGAKFPRSRQPALTIVVSPNANPAVLVSIDAVAAQVQPHNENPDPAKEPEAAAVSGDSLAMVLPKGSRIFIAGQAEQAESLAEATTRTMDSLERTLEFLGRSRSDIVQLKCFTMPIRESAIVEHTIREWFGDRPCPPIVQVEWSSGASTPIEIEVVAWGGPEELPARPWIEFITPPGMTTSPIYSRVVRTRSPWLIYTDGFQAFGPLADLNSTEAADYDVNSAFESLTSVMTHARSDLRHLVKATYYVSTDAASQGLNRLRPNYYDPQRPPAASKAVVAGVGQQQLGLQMDMISVPVEPANP